MNNSEFIEELKASPYYDRIFKGHNVIAAYIAGSRLAGVTDDRSDYDIVVITADDKSEYYPQEYLKYKGLKVHWYYESIYKWLFLSKDGTKYSSIPSCFGALLYLNSPQVEYIYINDKYAAVMDYISSVKADLSRTAYYLLYLNLQARIKPIIQQNEIKETDYTKYLYFVCMASYLAYNESVNTEFLKEIKRIRWQPVSDKYKQLAVERIKKYQQYIDTNYNVNTVISELQTFLISFTEILNKYL